MLRRMTVTGSLRIRIVQYCTDVPTPCEEVPMAWVVLVVAGLLEIVWAVALRSGDAIGRGPALVVTVVALAASVGLLGWTLREIPLGTAYAVWVGIGAA